MKGGTPSKNNAGYGELLQVTISLSSFTEVGGAHRCFTRRFYQVLYPGARFRAKATMTSPSQWIIGRSRRKIFEG